MQNRRDRVLSLPWPDQEVYVLRHKHVSPDVEVPARTGSGEGFYEKAAGLVASQKGSSVNARERQGVSVTWFVVSHTSSRVIVHDSHLPTNTTHAMRKNNTLDHGLTSNPWHVNGA
jgi:hypothetical protein